MCLQNMFMFICSLSLVGHTTMLVESQSVKMEEDVKSIRKTEHLVNLVDFENVSEWECQNLARGMEEDQIGSKYIVSFKLKVNKMG